MPTLFHTLLALLGRPRPLPAHRPLPSPDTPVIRYQPATGSTYRHGGDGRWWLIDAVPDAEPLGPWEAELLRPVAPSPLAAELQPPHPIPCGELARLLSIEAAARAWAAEADVPGTETPAGEALLDLLSEEEAHRG